MPEGTIKQQTVIPPAGYFACVVEPGERIRLVEVADQQVADFMSFDRADPREQLSMFTSRAIGLTWKLTASHTLYSNLSRPMWLIEEDTVRDNYCGGGYCNSRLNGARYGRADAPSCEDNLERALAPYGLDRRSFNADTSSFRGTDRKRNPVPSAREAVSCTGPTSRPRQPSPPTASRR